MHVRDRLLESVPEIEQVFIGAFPLDSLVEGPVAVIIRRPSSSSNWKGWREESTLELWVKRSAAEEQELDQIADKAALVLDQALLQSGQGVWMTLIHGASMDDRIDSELSARIRTLSLAAISPRPLGEAGRGTRDTWLEPLMKWSADLLGEHWKVYGSEWPVKPESPCILWRASEMSLTPIGRAGYRCAKQFDAFILTEDKEEEGSGLLKLSEHLASTAKLALDPAIRKYAAVSDVRVNPAAANDGYALSDRGVLGVTLTRNEPAASPGAAAPLMRQVHHATKN